MGKLAKRATERSRPRKPPHGSAGGNGTTARKSRPARRKRTLREMNRWLTERHDQILAAAQENCRRLTDKPTL